jgi:pimeloyl-ACP methyl ester carboxylesterase
MELVKKRVILLPGALALLVIALGLWFALGVKPPAVPDAAREKELLAAIADKDVVILFNSGGWGNTPPEAATDFAPILNGIRDTLAGRGYSSVIVPFVRAPRGLTGKIEDVKDYIESFKYSSMVLAAEVDFILDNAPGKQVIIAGLSNGGGLAARAMHNLGDRPGACGIVAGVPGWYPDYASDQILVLNNRGQDRLAASDYAALAAAVVKAPFRWLRGKITHQPISFALAIEIPGHEYPWSSPEVGPPVKDFLNARF